MASSKTTPATAGQAKAPEPADAYLKRHKAIPSRLRRMMPMDECGLVFPIVIFLLAGALWAFVWSAW